MAYRFLVRISRATGILPTCGIPRGRKKRCRAFCPNDGKLMDAMSLALFE